MRYKGTTVALASYHGIALTMVWVPPMPQQPNSFVTGDATGNGDITGTFQGSRFPYYGSVNCIDALYHPITCPGKAFLYTIAVNTTSFGIGFHTTPKIEITNTRAYPGTKCRIANLVRVKKKYLWQLIRMAYATPAGRTLTIRHTTNQLTFSSGGVYFFSYVCQ